MSGVIKIGTRGSALALTQSRWVQAQIMARHAECRVELEIIKTSGDIIHDVPLAKVGGKGLFIKEIEEALLSGRVDLAVHSLKDMPAEIPAGLLLGAVPIREDYRDAFISSRWASLAEIPMGGRIGTGSLRRRVQLLHQRPDLEIVPLRGNVDTRLKKMETLGLDALILAAAGLNRLGLNNVYQGLLTEEEMLPAVAQGALGLEVRTEDQRLREIIAFLDHPPTRIAVTAERAFLSRLEGGCVVPVAALGKVDGDDLTLEALISDLDGKCYLRERLSGHVDEAQTMGTDLADSLLDRGGREILAELFAHSL
ncbi:MAG: hydroxymethylbilane synthase [Deltaproteobacteria bacterium]|nr:hydroxymethylbilane synthase [Deltaproteobacteria bacterium]